MIVLQFTHDKRLENKCPATQVQSRAGAGQAQPCDGLQLLPRQLLLPGSGALSEQARYSHYRR